MWEMRNDTFLHDFPHELGRLLCDFTCADSNPSCHYSCTREISKFPTCPKWETAKVALCTVETRLGVGAIAATGAMLDVRAAAAAMVEDFIEEMEIQTAGELIWFGCAGLDSSSAPVDELMAVRATEPGSVGQ
ncbi:hypothetical protein KC19_9G142000 [Ceratodon purpureus]|uniref:Uncharacterized protein n=1 Tax=Ceratodon purpureus TaxID=3225 RepID=A0A8T0GVE0_CERPU|nr:hypothetical protein KC19_9G142000 [Ceratodon purpureus]